MSDIYRITELEQALHTINAARAISRCYHLSLEHPESSQHLNEQQDVILQIDNLIGSVKSVIEKEIQASTQDYREEKDSTGIQV